MIWLLASLVLSQSDSRPGPLDAFQANRAAISARVEYTYTFGRTNASVIDRDTIWINGIPFREDPDRTVVGLWESDGHTDHYVYQSPEDVIQRKKGLARAGQLLPYTIPFERLYDGEIDAHHDLGLPVSVSVTRKPAGLGASKGPFLWWGYEPFPNYVEEDFPDIRPNRSRGTAGGHACDVEVYRTKLDKGGWYQLEIFYDPSIGYLPRIVRVIGQIRDGDDANVKQMYLIDAQNVKSGSFVPAEWFEAFFRISSFQTKYPGYREGTKLVAQAGDVSIGRFKATKIEGFKGPPKLDHLSKVTYLAGPGGAIVPLSSNPAPLSIEEIRARFGRKLTNPKPSPMAIPHVDATELQDGLREPGRNHWGYLFFMLAVCAPAVAFGIRGVRRRLGTLSLIAAFTSCSAGCGQQVQPVVKLSAAFARSNIIYQAGFGRLSVPMVVTNEGNLPTTILAANGGCSCREIDHSKLPVTLEPGRAISLDVTLHERKILETQNIMISFDTDHGTLIGPAGLATLPSQSLTPDSHSNVALIEDEGWTFEVVHREIYDPSWARQVTALEAPKEFDAAPLKSESGKLLAFPPYEFRDKTYRVTLKDRTTGLHKAVLTLRGKDGALLDESPIIWQRFPFLSANPSTVRIAVRPVRVFLRCPDESVELSKVRSAPTGIKAVVSSSREVTVMLDANAPGIVDSAVVVETTATGRPPLKIPVIRYAPTTDAHAGTTTPGATPRRSQG